ncbi:hypothetical protein Pmani_000126 [Petrolisthes manimaculis]|uniref:Uncharacterized protein n=1 Tax=Petrolisthes manimaculis TaxID=1843537 RepID=A0AAE1QML7_9EUCA|nr:hypothetical protein Pmani_000126 [Petrolisthes manimaculis]
MHFKITRQSWNKGWCGCEGCAGRAGATLDTATRAQLLQRPRHNQQQPSCPGGCTREGQVNLSNRSVLLVSGVLGRAGRDILPGRHAGTLHQGGRHYITVTSHSRGLRHNHAWHGGVRGTPPPHNSANTSSSRHEPPLRAVPGTLTPALTDGLPTTAVP